MALLPYEKPYKTPKLLINKLITEELTIDQENLSHAERVLSNVNYYRFKAYSSPFRVRGNGKFIPETTFDNIEQLYHFDEELRNICFSHISKLEIQLRSRLDQVIASSENDPFWYIKNSVYATFGDMDSFAEHIEKKFRESDEEFVIHFKKNYKNPSNGDYPNLPPSWVAVELFTLGTLNTLFLKLNIDHFNVGSSDDKNHLNIMSKEFGAISFIQLRSWLEVIKQVRNKCAHHARLFNVKLKPWPKTSRLFEQTYKPEHERRIYVSLWMLHRMLNSIGTPKDTKHQIQQLFTMYPTAEKQQKAMGFPSNWEEDPHWII